MKFPSDFLSANPTTTRRAHWIHIDLGDTKRVSIVGKTIGMYTVKAILPESWKSYLLGILVNKVRK